jgi:cytochrome c551/c552
MKSLILAAVALTGIIPTAANAQESLARRNGCLNCHAVKSGDRQRSASSMEAIAKRYADKPDAEETLSKGLLEGTTNHPRIRGTPDETRAIVKWIMTLK